MPQVASGGSSEILTIVPCALRSSCPSFLLVSAKGNHSASNLGVGGVWFPVEHLVTRERFENKALVWHIEWPQYIIGRLVTSTNSNGTISNSDMELAGGLMHLEALAQSFDIREWTYGFVGRRIISSASWLQGRDKAIGIGNFSIVSTQHTYNPSIHIIQSGIGMCYI